MIKPPAFQFYPADYLSEEDVQYMTLEQEGAYLRAMCYCWREGSIPADANKLAVLIGKGCSTDVATSVQGSFKVCSTDVSRLVHPRLEKERAKQSAFRESAAEAGRISGQVRRDKAQSIINSKGSETNEPSTNPERPPERTLNSISSSISSSNNKSALTSADFTFPELLNREPCKLAVDKWLKHRREKKKALNRSSVEEILRQYAQRAGDLIRDINHSIKNGYQGLYAPNIPAPKEQFNPSKQPLNGNQKGILQRTGLNEPVKAGAILANLGNKKDEHHGKS